MDPFSRKLFKTRDARDQLRGMGGIVASSPVLAQTVQKYQVGGRINVNSAPMLDTTIDARAGRGTGRTSMMSGLIDPVLPSTVRATAPSETPTKRLSSEELMLKTQPVVVDRLGQITTVYVDPSNGKIYDPSGQDYNLLMSPSEYTSLEGDVNRRLASQSGEAARQLELTATEAQRDLESDPSGETLAAAAAARAAAQSAPDADIVERSAVERVLSRPSGSFEGRDVFAEEGPGATDLATMAGQREPNSNTGTPLEFSPDVMPPASADVEVAPPIEEEVVEAPDVEGPASDFDTSYANAMKRLSGVMGEGADEDSKKKAMANLAMIGLAIAAGQSPDALTNIAQGALTGMQGIQKADAAKEAQRKELELAAVKMAADEVDLNKRLASAERIAAMRTADGSTFSPQDRLYNSTFNTILDQTGSVEEAAAAAARAAPGSSQSMRGTVSSVGRIVEQNGVRYQQQADGTFKPLG